MRVIRPFECEIIVHGRNIPRERRVRWTDENRAVRAMLTRKKRICRSVGPEIVRTSFSRADFRSGTFHCRWTFEESPATLFAVRKIGANMRSECVFWASFFFLSRKNTISRFRRNVARSLILAVSKRHYGWVRVRSTFSDTNPVNRCKSR